MNLELTILHLKQDIKDLTTVNNRSLRHLTKLYGSKHRARRAKMRLQIKARIEQIKTIRVSLQLLGVES